VADADLPFCYLTTVGRKTGTPHRIEIWFARNPNTNTLYMLSGGRTRSDWVANLIAEPRCAIELGAATYKATARVLAEGTDEDELARTLVHDKYAQGDDLTAWRAEALPVAFDLD
jgi:deazaflavin-dependent oxidoreductase (nitroreductase family)